ncbi:methyl-accepting chemotaxis protein [Bradyrhizobium lablabi]|uniref:methyl-accepting chemotaxis protein n=1 Tax=Bradyrhizobium lablabi TaxID=722472 RepID=UPI001BA816CF|nr:methyl-accepting chemotaxis protein [Bradyrhizobium lablabi]MBR0695399.1 MCP four helix bundle domain-containing protein [Bradyrhizobium lablabi]
MPILAKIAVPAGIVALVAIAIVVQASLALSRLSATASDLVDGNARRVQYSLEAESYFNSAAVSEKNVILSGSDAKAIASNIENYDKATDATLAAVDRLAAVTTDAGQLHLIDTLRNAVKDRRVASAKVFELVTAGKFEDAFAYSRNVAAKYRQIAIAAASNLIAANVMGMQTARDQGVATANKTRLVLLFGAAAGLLCAFNILAWIAFSQIARPLSRMTQEMAKLAEGNLDIAIVGDDRTDEVGGLAKSLLVFKENAITARRLEAEQREGQSRKEARQHVIEKHIAIFDSQVTEALNALTAASTEMHATAGSMSAIAEETSRQATCVASASNEASANVQTVAVATEELHASISEITRQVTQAAETAKAAVDETGRTNTKVEHLAGAAQRIGEVVSLIQNIASQTNLLALNATIEAARAGESGRGFAVVANEVKALATQTAKATEEISSQIAAIQQETGDAVTAIRTIGGTIGRMSEIAAAISAAVEQQSAATRDISKNIQEVSRGTSEVSANVGSVNEAATETGSAAMQVLTAADDLSHQSTKLRTDVNTFLEKIRAA